MLMTGRLVPSSSASAFYSTVQKDAFRSREGAGLATELILSLKPTTKEIEDRHQLEGKS